MSWFEWICEDFNPGPVGGVTRHNNQRRRNRFFALITGMLALGVAFCPHYFLIQNFSGDELLKWMGVAAALEALYFLMGYKLDIRPDYSNMGWLGGVFDNPFRVSDDWNRSLLFFRILLMPGRWISIGLVDMGKALIFR